MIIADDLLHACNTQQIVLTDIKFNVINVTCNRQKWGEREIVY